MKDYKTFLITEGVYDPGIFKAYFLAGGPGSGKTFVTANAFAGTGLKLVNSDDIFERYLKQAGLSMKMPESEAEIRDDIRARAKAKTSGRLDLYIKGRLGLVIDGTGRDFEKISRQQRLLKFLGYDTNLIFVNTSLDVALERNAKRERSVPEYIATKNWNTVQSNMGKFHKLFGYQNMHVIDNNNSEQELVTTTLNRAAKIVRNTMNRPLGYIAKQWVNKELLLKRIKW